MVVPIALTQARHPSSHLMYRIALRGLNRAARDRFDTGIAVHLERGATTTASDSGAPLLRCTAAALTGPWTAPSRELERAFSGGEICAIDLDSFRFGRYQAGPATSNRSSRYREMAIVRFASSRT